jgi:hypothetical protein
MFTKKDEIDHKWRPASSPFKALLHYARKEEIAHRKLQKTRHAYIKERIEQREHLNREVAGLDKLLKENSIDEDTCARLKKLLEIGYEQKRQETREKHGFMKNLAASGAAY